MDDLSRAFEEIRAVRDCPAVRRLLFDLWELARRDGESEGLRFAAVYLVGLREFAAHERFVASLKRGIPGPVLGRAPLPAAGEWWGLLEDGTVVPSGDRRAGRAVYWCESGGAGWWSVPGAGER